MTAASRRRAGARQSPRPARGAVGVGQPSGLLDEHLIALVPPFAEPVGVKVGQHLGHARRFDRAGRSRKRGTTGSWREALGERSAVVKAGGAGVDRAHLLVAGPGESDLAVRVAGGQPSLQPGVLPLAEVLQE